MQTNHSSALRGLSIATIVVAGLCILACVIGFIMLGVGGSALAGVTPDMLEYYYDYDYYDYSYGYESALDGDDMMALIGLMLGIGGVALFWELACSVVALLAGIFGLRFYAKPDKMGLVFGWSLAGAIVSFLGGNIVAMVLLIIMTVFAYKDKQLATGAAAAAVVPAANAVAYTAPAAAQPVTAPAQPTPAQPAATPAAAPAVAATATPTAAAAPAVAPAATAAPAPATTPEATTPDSEKPEEPKAE